MSHVFDDSEDEYEDDYTESLKVISDLEKKIKENQPSNQKIEPKIEPQNIHNTVKTVSEVNVPIITYKPKNRDTVQGPTTSNTVMQTRSSNRLKYNTIELKTNDENYTYDSNGIIEVLMDEVGEDQEMEYVIADSMENENELDEALQSTDSNDEINSLIVDDNEFESDPFVLRNITKSNELYSSEESLGEKPTDDDETGIYNFQINIFN